MFTVGNRSESGEYVGRPSPLGNPYWMKDESKRDEVCDKYAEWFNRKVREHDPEVCEELQRLYRLGLQRPVKLICYCAPRRCHADTIANYLNKLQHLAGDADWTLP